MARGSRCTCDRTGDGSWIWRTKIWVTVDLRDPTRPQEVGRWWLPGTRKGDACLPGCLPPRHSPFDNGYRPHQIEIWPERADRAYVYIDGGGMIYANDRFTGGLYILRYTGQVPLD